MATDTPLVGKTIIELDPLTGAIDRVNSFIEVHVSGQDSSKKVALSAALLQGKSALEVIQQTHPEIVTDEQFIAFLTGPAGAAGKSAFELAVAAGFGGTQAEWLAGLKGDKGDKGEPGEPGTAGRDGIDGSKGNAGADGKSAYELAVAAGFEGTVDDYIASLQAQLTQPNLQALLDQFNWSFKQVWKTLSSVGVISSNSVFANFLQVFDKRIASNNFDMSASGKVAQRVMEQGFLDQEGLAYIKISKAPNSAADPQRPENSRAVLFLRDNGTVGVGDNNNNVVIGDGSRITVTVAGVATIYDLSTFGAGGGGGANGKSAYELAVQEGFVGTLQQWLASLIGIQGEPGLKGDAGTNGTNGTDGAVGKSAYEVAVQGGFQGDVNAWLLSLKGGKGDKGNNGDPGLKGDQGEKGNDGTAGTNGTDGAAGKSAYEVAVAQGYVGDEASWLISIIGQRGAKGDAGNTGADGRTAYQLAVADGFAGTEIEWLASLHGAKGDKGEQGTGGVAGQSAYEQAVATGFVGTIEEWIASLHGTNGKSAYEVAVAGGFVGTQVQWLASLQGTNGTNGVAGSQWHQAAGLPSVSVGVDSDFYVNTTTGDVYGPKTAGVWGNITQNLKGPAGTNGTNGTAGTNGTNGANAVIGTLQGVLATVGDLPPATEFVNGDYFWIGAHAWMCLNAEWVDLGDFAGPQGKDGTGYVILGELANTSLLPAEGEHIGDTWLIGGYQYVWSGTTWTQQGVKGEKGDKGDQGNIGLDGKSSFDVVKAANPAVDTMAKYVEFIRGLQGVKGDTAISFVADGTLPTVGDLPASGTENHGYLIGADGNYEFHVWVNGAWVNMGSNVGPQGEPGVKGDSGNVGATGTSMTPKGVLADVDLLPTSGNQVGDTYTIAGDFWAWNGTTWIDQGNFTGGKGDKGDVGSPVNAKGSVADQSQLPPTGNAIGDAYVIVDHIWVWGSAGWADMGIWRGASGANGKTAYQVAVDGGFVGDQAAWLASLKGAKGDKGDAGIKGDTGNTGTNGTDGAQGPMGHGLTPKGNVDTPANLPATGNQVGDFYFINTTFASAAWNGTTWVNAGNWRGADGKSAYDVAVAAGFSGDVNAWLASLKGAKGDTGNTGTNGTNGKSAYELAVQGGYTGDLPTWIASLNGATGATGKSLYQDAVDRGLFSGTFDQFLAAQKGATGYSAYEEAKANGTIAASASFANFLTLITGPQGVEGQQGVQGATGPAIRIIGTLANQAALPATGIEGTGYAIDDPAATGTFNCWIWLSASSSWFNLGHVVGATGPQGNPGVRGIQGVKGDKGDLGDQGTLWIVLTRDPIANDGRINDYFFNSNTQEFFRKTSATVWASLGHIGGGNLNAPAATGKLRGYSDTGWTDLPAVVNALPSGTDGKNYTLINGTWVANSLLNTIPVDTGTYVLKSGVWTRFDTYTLKAVDVAIAASAGTIDLNVARIFRIANTGAATIALTNLPANDRGTTIVVKVTGKVGAFQWTLPSGSIRWFDGAAPTFANNITTIVFNWDGVEMVGSVPN